MKYFYDGRLLYDLKEVHIVFEDEIDGFGPYGGGFYEVINLDVNEFECYYNKIGKKKFMNYVGKVYYMKFRCEEIYERLKEIAEEI